jgi:hypothetical protein
MVWITLFLVKKLGFLLEGFGINSKQAYSILKIRFTMENRKVSPLRGKRNKEFATNQLLFTSIIYIVFGLFVLFVSYQFNQPILKFFLSISMILIMLCLGFITEFFSSLIDTSDADILLPRPITAKTLVTSKIIQIMALLTHICLSLALPTLIYFWVSYGTLIGLAFLLACILLAFLSLVITNGFYATLMRFISGERLKDIINYIQIIFVVGIMALYQFSLNTIDIETYANTGLKLNWWHIFIPSTWFALPLNALATSTFSVQIAINSMLALLIPTIGLAYIIQLQAKKFTQHIGALKTASSKKKEKGSTSTFSHTMAKWFTKPGLEKAAFKVIWKISSRDRQFKLSAYPGFGYFLVFAVVYLYNQFAKGEVTLHSLEDSQNHLYVLYMASISGIAILFQMPYSEMPQANTFWTSTPHYHPGKILRAGLKVLLVKYTLPVYGILTFPILYFWGPWAFFDIVFSFFGIATVLGFINLVIIKQLPFSTEKAMQDRGANMAGMFLFMACLAGIGFGHYGLSKIPLGVELGSLVLIAVFWLSMKWAGGFKKNKK